MRRLFILLLVSLLSLLSCATPPKPVTISEVALNPEVYKNEPVKLEGLVKDNRYFEGILAGWELLVTDGKNELYCFKNGYDRSLLRNGVKLAEEAKEEGGKVTVTGRPLSPQGFKIRPSLEIQGISYKNKSVDVETADYPYYWPLYSHSYSPQYPYYYDPQYPDYYFLPRPPYYHYFRYPYYRPH